MLATVYAPREYKTKIISVSNVPFAEMGTGSFCDYSLWARGSTDKDFASMVDKVIASRPSDLILVSHAYIGGMYAQWWRTYENALGRSEVKWRGFDEWVRAGKSANDLIPKSRSIARSSTRRRSRQCRSKSSNCFLMCLAATTPAERAIFGSRPVRLEKNWRAIAPIKRLLLNCGPHRPAASPVVGDRRRSFRSRYDPRSGHDADRER